MIQRFKSFFGQPGPLAAEGHSRPLPPSPAPGRRPSPPEGPVRELSGRYGVTDLSPGGADRRLTSRGPHQEPDRHVNANFHDAHYGFTARSAARIEGKRLAHRRAAAFEVQCAVEASRGACSDPKAMSAEGMQRLLEAVRLLGESGGVKVTHLRALRSLERSGFRQPLRPLLRELGDQAPYPAPKEATRVVYFHTRRVEAGREQTVPSPGPSQARDLPSQGGPRIVYFHTRREAAASERPEPGPRPAQAPSAT